MGFAHLDIATTGLFFLQKYFQGYLGLCNNLGIKYLKWEVFSSYFCDIFVEVVRYIYWLFLVFDRTSSP